MSAAKGAKGAAKPKRPSGSQNRKARAARLETELAKAGLLAKGYAERLGPAPLDDPSELVSWLARVGAVQVEEALTIPDMQARHKAVASLLAKIGLLSSKTQFAGRVEAIEKRLAELATPQANGAPAQAAETPEPPLVVPARGTPLWTAWESRGALPAEGANVVEAPEHSRAYRQLLAKEPT